MHTYNILGDLGIPKDVIGVIEGHRRAQFYHERVLPFESKSWFAIGVRADLDGVMVLIDDYISSNHMRSDILDVDIQISFMIWIYNRMQGVHYDWGEFEDINIEQWRQLMS